MDSADLIIKVVLIVGGVVGLLLACLGYYIKKYHEKVDALERDAARKSEITRIENRIVESVEALDNKLNEKLDLLIAVGAIGKAKQ